MEMNPSTDKGHWLGRYSVSIKTMVTVAVAWIVVAIGFYQTPSSNYLEAKLSTPINFYSRDLLGSTPVQDPRLKIFVFDDKAFAKMGSPMLALDLWGDLLDGIAESKPKAIFIDAMLSAKPEETAKQISFYFSRLQELKVPVILGSFVSPQELPFKEPLNLSEPWYQASTYIAQNQAESGRVNDQLWKLPKKHKGMHAYGPAKELQSYFPKSGQFQLFEENKIEPFIYLGQGRVVPHMSLFAADKVLADDGAIVVDGKRVALDRFGSLDINFLPQDRWQLLPLIDAIEDVKAGYKPSHVSAGDIVLILPLYFTGNTDFRPSPYGLIPGGLIPAALINSVLSGQWIQTVLASEALIILGVVAIALSISFLNTIGFWSLVLVMEFALFAGAQIAFAKFSLIVPWLLPSLAWAGVGIHLFVLKMQSDERKVLVLKSALDGAVDPAQMQRMLSRPEDVNFEARERVLTLMFIDVVGFSLSAENMLPRLAFDTLKEILIEMGRTVHEYGGIVDKTLGDGLLCYFGYRFDTDETSTDHAEQALKAAIHIQDSNRERNLKSMAAGEPLFPLRIGINTASSYLGDIGSGQRIEFTVVGNGVNFAKRLEGACEMFSILIGPTTWELIKGIDVDAGAITRKLIRIKHHKELIDAYEYDPMFKKRELRAQIAEAFRRSANLQRLNERIPINDASAIKVLSEHGEGTVVNFSGTGISLQFRAPLPRGSFFKFSLESKDPGLLAILRSLGMGVIEAEVKWNYQSAGGFVHGLLFRSMEEELREHFVRTVSEFAFIGDSAKAPQVGETNAAS